MIVTKTAFADMAGISQGMVSLGIKRGNLLPTADGNIDTENPPNAIYLATRRQKGKAPPVVGINKQKPRKQKIEKPALPPPPLAQLGGLDLPLDNIDDEDDDRDYDQTDKLKAGVRLQIAQAKRHELKYAMDKKLVVPWELVDRMNAKARMELKTRLQDMPRRLTALLAAMARASPDDKPIEARFQQEVDDVLQMFAKSLEDGLE